MVQKEALINEIVLRFKNILEIEGAKDLSLMDLQTIWSRVLSDARPTSCQASPKNPCCDLGQP